MTEVPPPRLDDSRSAPLQRGFALFGRGLIYALAFFIVYAALYRAPWFGPSDLNDQRTQQYWKSYDEQTARAEKAWSSAEDQTKRMDAILTKQEELMRRWEAIIASWEKQSTSKR